MKPARNPWPLAIIITFVLFVGSTAGLVVMACRQTADLVTPNYYEQELKFQNRIDDLKRAGELGDRASIRFDRGRGCLSITLPPEQIKAGLSGTIQLYRPSAAGQDRELRLAPAAGGVQTVPVDRLLPGLWKVRVQWTASGRQYLLDQAFTNALPSGAAL